MTASFSLNRLRVIRRGQAVYDQVFHMGVNIIRGENGCGKSSISDFIFYILGGEFDRWKAAPSQCDEVQAEVTTQGGVVTLRREIKTAQTPISVFFGPMADAEKHALDGWTPYSIRRSENRESFSQIMFRSSGIPEAQSQGSANITMNQILRLLYADQRTPAALLFKFVDFDTREIREAVGDLICGLSVYDMYDAELKLRDLKVKFDDASRRLTALIQSLPVEEGLANIDNIEKRVRELSIEEERVTAEARNVDAIIGDAETGEFLKERRSALSKLTKLKNKIILAEGAVETLSFEITDIEQFVDYLADLADKLPRAQASAELVGNIEFTHCPACLTPLKDTTDKEHCAVCGSEADPEREQSKYLSIKLDLDIQLREARQLLVEKRDELARNQRDSRELSRVYEGLLSEFGTKYDISIAPRESYLAARYQRLGQIGRDKEYLGRLRERALQVRTLSNEKAALQGEITKVEDLRKALEFQSKRRRSIALTAISDIARDLLHADMERQEEFKKADNVSIRFADNAISVDGEMNFADSSSVILKNSAILSIFSAATLDQAFYHPKFLLLDNVEDKGMEPVRSHNFQKLIVERSEAAKVEHQIIFTTSMICGELNVDKYTIGPEYTHEHRTLEFKPA
ncbi:MAG: AAA family ATPase [Alphaproteobacteria bacterium]|nr:AAA family ATPase [Alphaproteobacteria bacterium]